MPLTLYVDGDRWRAHLRAVHAAHPGLVPVAKGNGYGFGLHRLARRAGWLGVDTLAVGTYDELEEVSSRFPGDLLVLTPWRPGPEQTQDVPDLGKRVLHTVSRAADAEALAASAAPSSGRPRVLLEALTSMRRHGMTAAELRAAADVVRRGGVRFEGFALHLPLGTGSHLPEVRRLLVDLVATGLTQDRRTTVWVSHLTDAELGTLAAEYPDLAFRPRVGTDLWLGDRDALRVRATVLDAHPLRRGDVYGYRGRTAPRAGTLLVVAGGTAHGIGLEAPTGAGSVRAKAASLARGGLDAAGWVRSPYTVTGKTRLFAEPPHMQASMLFLPAGAEVPAVGDEVDVRVRFTATQVDRVVVSPPTAG